MRTLTLRVRESFWFLPAVVGVLAIVLAEVLVGVDRAVLASGVEIPFLDALSASGGRSILTTIGTSMLTVAGTSFSITISVLATTSSTYGPRLVRNFMADRANQAVLAAFTATFLYAIVVLRSVHTDVDDGTAFVPVIAVHVAVLIGVLDVAVLVFFIHHIASSVQVTSLQKRVQVDLVAAVHEAYRAADDDHGDVVVGTPVDGRAGAAELLRSDRDGYVQSVDWGRLVAWADDHDRVLDVRAMPGDHVVDGDALFGVGATRAPGSDGGNGASTLDDRAVSSLRAAVTIGTARTPLQDVRFALQQLVEIAVRGLASGSNDPYTAVSALDLSATALVPAWRDGSAVTGHRGADGTVRVVVHWPSLEQLVDSLYEGVLTYGTDHPIVLRAALHLADRLEASAAPGRRGHLDRTRRLLERHLGTALPLRRRGGGRSRTAGVPHWLDRLMTGKQHDVTLHIGPEELRIRGVYEVVSIVNDVMVALWFVVGSVLFFSESTTTVGTWFFLIGSIQLLIRPLIRLTRRVHLGRIAPEGPASSSRDL